jgi:hypothetical protein
MLVPVLVVGRADDAALLRPGTGYDDDGVAYDLLGRSAAFMPAGLGGEAAFFTIYVTTTHYEATTVLRVTPAIDGVTLASTDIVLGTSDPAGEQNVHEIDLSQAYTVGGVEKLRYAPRGQRLDVTIETLRGATLGVGARQIVDGIEVEFEVVQEGKQPVVNA